MEHPPPAECCTDLGQDDDPPSKIEIVLLAVLAILACFGVAILLAIKFPVA